MLVIREALEADLEMVYSLEVDVMPQPWTKGAILEAILSVNTIFLVAVVDDVVVAFVIVYCMPPESELPDIVVSRDYRRQGLAGALIREIFSRLESMQITDLFLEVRESNEAAKALYESFGFKEIGIRKNFYINPVEHAVCMKRILDSV